MLMRTCSRVPRNAVGTTTGHVGTPPSWQQLLLESSWACWRRLKMTNRFDVGSGDGDTPALLTVSTYEFRSAARRPIERTQRPGIVHTSAPQMNVEIASLRRAEPAALCRKPDFDHLTGRAGQSRIAAHKLLNTVLHRMFRFCAVSWALDLLQPGSVQQLATVASCSATDVVRPRLCGQVE